MNGWSVGSDDDDDDDDNAMSAFELAFGAEHQPISAAQRNAVYDDGISLNSNDDGPSTDLSSDSTFVGESDDDNDDDVEPMPLRSMANAAAESSDDDDDDDDGEEPAAAAAAPASASSRSLPVQRRVSAATCPVCWDEQPYIADVSKRTAMSERFADYREVMYRYYNAVRGRQSQETVLRGMLDIRREKIERYLAEYSSVRFTRWTMDMLRDHFDPRNGHRFDPVLALEHEIEELDQLKRWTMEHGMWVDHPQTGERVFNIRAVDVRLRISREYQQCIQRKSAELERRARAGQTGGESDMIMQALVDHSAAAKRKKRRVVGGDNGAAATDESTAVDRMYQVGRL